MKALLIVDVQNDFCSGGVLEAPDGDKVVPVINTLLDQFPLVIASKDWHPEQSVHFDKWPPHCVRDTHGAAFHPLLQTEKIDQVVLKGTNDKDDGYSAFEATNIDLASFLKEKKVDDLYVCGLATDYCVRSTALDAQKLGFNTFVIQDAIKGVNVHPHDAERALDEMKHNEIVLVTSDMIPGEVR